MRCVIKVLGMVMAYITFILCLMGQHRTMYTVTNGIDTEE